MQSTPSACTWAVWMPQRSSTQLGVLGACITPGHTLTTLLRKAVICQAVRAWHAMCCKERAALWIHCLQACILVKHMCEGLSPVHTAVRPPTHPQ
jgi:hypothetical protein